MSLKYFVFICDYCVANGSVHAMDQELMHILRLNIYLIVDLIYWKKK